MVSRSAAADCAKCRIRSALRGQPRPKSVSDHQRQPIHSRPRESVPPASSCRTNALPRIAGRHPGIDRSSKLHRSSSHPRAHEYRLLRLPRTPDRIPKHPSLWNQLTLKSAYTFSKTTDNASEIGATLAAGGTFAISQSQVNFTDQEHSLSGLDFPQNWVLTALEDLPFYRHQSGFSGPRPRRLESLGRLSHFTRANHSQQLSRDLIAPAAAARAAEFPMPKIHMIPPLTLHLAGPDGSLAAFPRRARRAGAVRRHLRQRYLRRGHQWESLRKSRHPPTTLISLNEFNNGFTGTKTDAGKYRARSSPRPERRHQEQVRFIANTQPPTRCSARHSAMWVEILCATRKQTSSIFRFSK